MVLNALAIIVVVIAAGFGITVVLRRLRRTEQTLARKNKELERRLYELSVSQSVSSQIGYTLQIQTVIDNIVEALTHVVAHSALSYCLVEDHTITQKTIEKATIGKVFNDSFKKQSVGILEKNLPNFHQFSVIDSIQKEYDIEDTPKEDLPPASFFGLPLIINNMCVGSISVASNTPGSFSDEDEDLIRRIVSNTLETVGKMEEIINTEKGKLDSFLFSLSSGAILFLIDHDILKLSAINSAARQFLHIGGEIDTATVIAHFGMHHDLIKDITDVVQDKKSMLIKNVQIYDRFLKVFLNPVFQATTDKVIGVAVTMEDVTIERDIEDIRETFTSMVVHELRAPLTSIKGAAAMLMAGKLGKEDQEKMLTVVHDSTERMLMDIGDILDVSKLEAGKFTLNKSMNDLNKLIEERILTFSFAAETRHVHITPHLDAGITPIVFDAQRIGQVLNNLLSNSLKFTPDNGEITVTTASQDGQILISVHDTGLGVPKEKKSLLFSKYGQLAGSLHKEGGTGLGLYISKGIVESHGGKIWLDETGSGATFSFTLPIVTHVENASDAPPPPVPTASKIAPGRIVN